MPISVNEHGDITTFSSVAEAEAYMEPIDVERNEYVVTDADGRVLCLQIVEKEIPLFWGLWKKSIKGVGIIDPVKSTRITDGVSLD